MINNQVLSCKHYYNQLIAFDANENMTRRRVFTCVENVPFLRQRVIGHGSHLYARLVYFGIGAFHFGGTFHVHFILVHVHPIFFQREPQSQRRVVKRPVGYFVFVTFKQVSVHLKSDVQIVHWTHIVFDRGRVRNGTKI